MNPANPTVSRILSPTQFQSEDFPSEDFPDTEAMFNKVSNTISTTAIVGTVMGLLVVVVLIVGIFWFYRRRRRSEQRREIQPRIEHGNPYATHQVAPATGSSLSPAVDIDHTPNGSSGLTINPNSTPAGVTPYMKSYHDPRLTIPSRNNGSHLHVEPDHTHTVTTSPSPSNEEITYSASSNTEDDVQASSRTDDPGLRDVVRALTERVDAMDRPPSYVPGINSQRPGESAF